MARWGMSFLAGVLTGLLAAGLLLLLTAPPRGRPVELKPPPTPGPLRVHVAGSVRQPGVYELPRGAIVLDALEAAGGPAPQARLEAINLAEPLQDGTRVFIPGAEAGGAAPAQAPALEPAEPTAETQGPIDPNTATAAELERLPGIGPVLAQNIIDYREAYGPFTRAEDLLKVPGIGEARLEQIRPYLALP